MVLIKHADFMLFANDEIYQKYKRNLNCSYIIDKYTGKTTGYSQEILAAELQLHGKFGLTDQGQSIKISRGATVLQLMKTELRLHSL